MKQFFKEYSYTAVKLFLNQFAIALFGLALAFACGKGKNESLRLWTSIFSVIFYLFLQYAVMWERGAKDGIRAEARGEGRGLWRGLAVSAVANGINILLALLILVGSFGADGTTLAGLGATFSVFALLLEGMYIGILATPLMGAALNSYAWVYVLIIIPAIAVCSGAYILGSYNLHFTNILIPKNKDVKNNGRPQRKKNK